MIELSAFIVPIVTAIIVSALCTFAGSWFAFSTRLARLETKLDTIEKKQDKHNDVIGRTYKIEERLEYIDRSVDEIKNEIARYHHHD